MIKRISITGTESTGKTTLAAQLAAHYKTIFVPDYSRLYIAAIKHKYTQHDVLQIAQGIIEYENDMLHLANHILFSDNDLINIKIWLQYYNWPVPAWLDSEIEKRKYDLYLLCNIDLPWIADEQRNNQHDRAELYGRFVELLNAIHANYIIVRGNESDRFNEATKAINNFST